MKIHDLEYKDKIRTAAFDLRFLLERGYRKRSALNFVANRYLLDMRQRNHLTRTVFSRAKSIKRQENSWTFTT